jgi:hypothetical protein
MTLALNHLRLPKCPDPACLACGLPLSDVRPYRSVAPNKRLVLVNALALCRCGHRHIVVRALAVTFTSLKFKAQTAYTYTQDHQAELDATLEFLTLGADGADAHLHDLPDTPELVIWFENTLHDAHRAGPASPVPGLPTDQLPQGEGICILETRAHDPDFLIGVRLRAHSPDHARRYVQDLRDLARRHGTVAWVRRYDITAHAVRWDIHAPAPGSEAFLKRAG